MYIKSIIKIKFEKKYLHANALDNKYFERLF